MLLLYHTISCITRIEKYFLSTSNSIPYAGGDFGWLPMLKTKHIYLTRMTGKICLRSGGLTLYTYLPAIIVPIWAIALPSLLIFPFLNFMTSYSIQFQAYISHNSADDLTLPCNSMHWRTYLV